MLGLIINPGPTGPFSGLLPILYLDPGSGSMIIQLLVAGALAALFFFRGYWKKLIDKFRKPKGPTEDPDDHEDW
jgi:hypothetical protein